MNPWLLLALGGAWLASMAGAAGVAYSAGRDRCEAAAAREERVAVAAAAKVADVAASAISQIKVQHVTIRQRVERTLRTDVRYEQCRHAAGVLDDINAARTGRPASAASSVPAASTAHR